MPETRGSRLGQVMELRGYVVPKDKQRDDVGDEFEDESEDDEEQEPEFLDVAEIDQVNSGGHVFHSSVCVCKVDLWTFSGEAYQVEGRFPFMGPWWEVTCSVLKRGAWFVMKGFPSYKLRSDLGREDWIHIVSLFLTECNVEENFVSQLFDWLPENRILSLHNLMDVLGEFSEGGKRDEARMITARVSVSAAWMQVQALHLYPHINKYLLKLLPRHFTVLLGMEKKGPTLQVTQATQNTQHRDDCQEEGANFHLLGKLEQIIAEDVWKLGFSNLVYKELELVRCEAQLRAFEECNLLQDIPPLQRHSLMAYNELKKYCHSYGSTFIERQDLCKILTRGELMSDEQAWEAIYFLKEQAVVVLPTGKVVLQKFDFYETGIAESLRSLSEQGRWNIPVNPVEVLQAAAEERQQEKIKNAKEATSHPVEDSKSVSVSTNIPDLPSNDKAGPLVKSEPELDQNPPFGDPEQQTINSSPIKLDQDHIQAAKMICANPVTVISGKAGCGKTTVVSQLFKAAVQGQKASSDSENDTAGSPLSELEDVNRAIQSNEEILLTAPTGRAASLLSKKTQFKAYTLHQVLHKYTNFMRKMKKRGTTDPEQWQFKNVRVLIVDEGSMVPVQLLHSVLKILIQHANLRKFIILGDIRQLPSIDPGNVLNDLYNTLKRIGWAIDMRTNHRAESELIIENAELIAKVGMNRNRFLNFPVKLKYDAVVDLCRPHTALTPDKRFILIRLPARGADDDLQRAVKFLIVNAPGLDNHSTSQFIAFKRNHKKKLNFQPGDKVCCTRNGYVALEEEDINKDQSQAEKTQNDCEKDSEKERPPARLCNGEIFFIKDDVTKVEGKRHCRSLTLDDGDGYIFTVDYRELQKECKLQHAWARTIHTFQGSENETIVYIVGDSRNQGWKHIYTAITRGQKRVYVVSKEEVVESTIKRPEILRKTRLGGLVKEYVVQGQELVGTPQAQLSTPKGTPTGCGVQQSTPLRTQTPGRPVGSRDMSAPVQRKCLWKAEDEEAAESPTEDNVSSPAMKSDQLAAPLAAQAMEGNEAITATSPGHKRQMPLSAEHKEVPCKQSCPAGGSCFTHD
ncbi:DNA helicase B isoform X2 [Betta splendens]|uniref:DNA helicase B isoform X2 n=1 Tax=Betta splendens TaxID=158456 RepID=A0A6P7NBH0_BETSP|nr:DNA helicase B isoform X2 [Betta splendens]